MEAYLNQVGNTYAYAYDAAGRKTNEVCTGIGTTSFCYDPSGNLTNLVDGKLHSTFWKYDQYSRVTNKVDALGTTTFAYGYDANNRLTSRFGGTNGTTLYGYDHVGNLTSVVYPHNTNIFLQYDLLNRVTNRVDALGTSLYSYDSVGQLLSEAGPWSGDSVTNTYANRLRQSSTVKAPNGTSWAQNYYYDAARRLTNVTSGSDGFTYQFAPGVQGLPSGISLPNGSSVANYYDSVGRLQTTALKSSQGATNNLHQYGYNGANQRTNQTRLNGDYVSYSYDNAGQLRTAVGKELGGSPNRLQEQLSYGYDAAGNLASRTNNALVETFTVNNANELVTTAPSGTLTVAGGTVAAATSVTISGNASGTITPYRDSTWALPNAALPNGSATYTATASDGQGHQAVASVFVNLPSSVSYSYDPSGNLVSDGYRYFAYDDENQLISVWVPNLWRTCFAYDGQMRLRKRTECSWSGSNWTTNSTVLYLYDGNVVVQEQDANNIPKVSYTRGRDLSGSMQGAGGIGGLLARTDHSTGTRTYYHADGNGNITCLIDASQTVVARYLYDPYGKVLSQSGPMAEANVYRFSSKEFHANSGLVYYLYRFYDPNLQRWPNRDPIGEAGFESIRQPVINQYSDGPNAYTFVLNDPVNEEDYLGLATSGGPYHPPNGVSPGCDPSDSCARLRAKMTLLMRMLGSHIGWDRNNPPPRGGGRHSDEIADLWRAYARCQAISAAKNCHDPKPPSVWVRVVCKVPGSDQLWNNIGAASGLIGLGSLAGAGIIATGGALGPVLAPAAF
jgi:RHS repeat-associated protein